MIASHPLTVACALPAAGALAGLVFFRKPAIAAALRRSAAIVAALAVAVALWGYRPRADDAATIRIIEPAFQLIPAWCVAWAPEADGAALILALAVASIVAAALSLRRDLSPAAGTFLLLAASCALGAIFSSDMLLFLALTEGALALVVLAAATGDDRARLAARRALITLFATAPPAAIALFALHWRAGGAGFVAADLVRAAIELPPGAQALVFAAFALTLGARAPVPPFHTWFTETTRTAPAAVAAIVPAMATSLAIHGLLRHVLPLLPAASGDAARALGWIAAFGVLHAGMIGYSRREPEWVFAHVAAAFGSLAVVGIVAATRPSVAGAVFLVATQTPVIAAVLLILAAMRDRGETSFARILHTRPRLTAVVALLVLALAGVPGTAAFVAQILMLAGAFDQYPGMAGAAALGLVPVTIALLALLRHAGDDLPPGGPRPRRLATPDALAFAAALAIVIALGVRPNAALSRLAPSVDRFAEEIRHRRAMDRIVREPLRAVENPFDEENAPGGAGAKGAAP